MLMWVEIILVEEKDKLGIRLDYIDFNNFIDIIEYKVYPLKLIYLAYTQVSM